MRKPIDIIMHPDSTTTFEDYKQAYLDDIPRIVQIKLRDSENPLKVPSLGFGLRNFFLMPKEYQNEIIDAYLTALEKVGFKAEKNEGKCFGLSWKLIKETAV